MKREAEDVFVAFESRPPGGVPSDGASGQHEKNAPAGFGGLPGASMASDEMVVGFDRRGGVTKLRLTDPLMQRAEQSTLWITASEDGASDGQHRASIFILSRAFELTDMIIIKASLLGSALMLLEGCSYLTSCELSGGCPFGPNREP